MLNPGGINRAPLCRREPEKAYTSTDARGAVVWAGFSEVHAEIYKGS
jgi:hypothetical protein